MKYIKNQYFQGQKTEGKYREDKLVFIRHRGFSVKTSKQMTKRNRGKTICFGDSVRQRFGCVLANAKLP
jgi:hypothetical protein